MTDWQPTADDRVQVRLKRGPLSALKLGTYRSRYVLGAGSVDIDRLPPFEPDSDGLYSLGYQARVYREEPVRDGEVRCEVCRRVFCQSIGGKPWRHSCTPEEVGWTLLRKIFPTPQKACAAGLEKIQPVFDAQMSWPVGNGKRVA